MKFFADKVSQIQMERECSVEKPAYNSVLIDSELRNDGKILPLAFSLVPMICPGAGAAVLQSASLHSLSRVPAQEEMSVWGQSGRGQAAWQIFSQN